MGSIAAIVFIAVAAIAGIYTGFKPTVINGKAMAARMMEKAGPKGVTKIECEDVPVTRSGVAYTCKLWGSDGSTARFKYEWGRSGPAKASMIDSTGPALER